MDGMPFVLRIFGVRVYHFNYAVIAYDWFPDWKSYKKVVIAFTCYFNILYVRAGTWRRFAFTILSPYQQIFFAVPLFLQLFLSLYYHEGLLPHDSLYILVHFQIDIDY